MESYTEKLYGERGTFRHNLQRYLKSEVFNSGCRLPRGLEDIPEITFSDIRMIVKREEYFQNLSRRVTEVYSNLEKEGQLTEVAEYEIAGILGLCPGQCDWHETLFPHAVDLFVSSDKEACQMFESIAENRNYISVMVRTMLDGLRDRQIINVNGNDTYSIGYARNYFRGESAYYGESRPTLFRNMPNEPSEKEERIIVGTLRIVEFGLWMNTLSFVKQWPYGTVMHGAVAQHYGIPTNAMDITSDIKTALFFACCSYENGSWRPLRKDEFAKPDSRKQIAALGGNSEYGILFSAPVDIAEMSRIANIPQLHFTRGTPIGYQPFMRCACQSGFIIEAGDAYNMYRDRSFAKVKFRHTEEICDWIYHEMNEGALVYPNEPFGCCDDIAEAVKNTRCFSERALNLTLKHLNMEERYEEIKKSLKIKGYEIKQEINLCSDERTRELEELWQRNIYSYPQLQKSPQFRFGFTVC